MRVCCGFVAFVLACTLASAPARAQSCNFSISTLDFGNVNLAANTAFTSTASFSVNCTGTASSTIRVCPNIDAGSGGTTNGDPRFLLNGGDTLNFNLFQDGGYGSVWGSSLWGFSGPFPPPTIDVGLNSSGNGSASRTIYGRISAGQRTLLAGTYTSSFAAAQTTMAYDYSTVGTCATIAGSHGTSAAFTVTANNQTTCSVSATTVNFGSSGVLQAALSAAGTIGVTCTNAAPFTISLDGGLAAALDPALRKMTLLTEEITYGLFQNSGFTLPWGDSLNINTMSSVGTGLLQNFTVYGRVPAQSTPAPGTYTDTVVVTLNY